MEVISYQWEENDQLSSAEDWIEGREVYSLPGNSSLILGLASTVVMSDVPGNETGMQQRDLTPTQRHTELLNRTALTLVALTLQSWLFKSEDYFFTVYIFGI